MEHMFNMIISKNHLFFHQLRMLFNEEENKLEEMKSFQSKETNDGSDICNCKEMYSESILTSMNCIKMICNIIKNCIMMGDVDVIKCLLSDEMYLMTFGVFEYESESSRMEQHRKYFEEIVTFKNILEITDENILRNIHLNHRLCYLRDTVMGRFIDENTSMMITNIIKQNDNEIIEFFINNKSFLLKLIHYIGNDNDILLQKDACDMLLELMSSASKDIIKDPFAKSSYSNIYSSLCECNILNILQRIIRKNTLISQYQKYIQSQLHINEITTSVNESNNINTSSYNNDYIKNIEEQIIISSIQILINILTADPSLICEYIKHKDSTLLLDLCNIIIYHENFCIKWEIDQSIIHPLILYENSTLLSLQSDNYINIFFNNGILSLLQYLSIPLTSQYKYEIISTKQIIIDIIIHCIESYTSNIEQWMIHNNVLSKVLTALSDNNKVINLYIVKFIKCIVLRTSECVYDNSICNILDKCLEMIEYKKHKKKEGVLVSAICELFLYLKVMKCMKFKEWVNERKDVLNKIKMFEEILEKGCDGIERKIKEDVRNEGRWWEEGCGNGNEDFFKGEGDDNDNDNNEERLLGKKTMPSKNLEDLIIEQNENEESFIDIIKQRKCFSNKYNDNELYENE